jgi:hypothetical protein
MTLPGESNSPEDSFDADYLKSLAPTELVTALLDDAQQSASLLSGIDRERVDNELMAILHVPTEAEQAEYEEHTAKVHSLLGELGNAFSAVGEKLDPPEDAEEQLSRNPTYRAVKQIDHIKGQIELGIQGEGEDDWVVGSTEHALMQILKTQKQVGLTYASAYVRETAVTALAEWSSYRGVVLLQNAVDGDQDSYEIGIEAFEEALSKHGFGWGEAYEGLEKVLELLEIQGPEQQERLTDLAIDMLAQLRGWNHPGLGSYTSRYATAAACFAVVVRNLGNS